MFKYVWRVSYTKISKYSGNKHKLNVKENDREKENPVKKEKEDTDEFKTT